MELLEILKLQIQIITQGLYFINIAALVIIPLLAARVFSWRTNYFGFAGMIAVLVLMEFLIPSDPLFVLIGLIAGIILGEATKNRATSKSKEEIQRAWQELFEQGELEHYQEDGEVVFGPPIHLNDTLQDLQVGQEVIYDNDGTDIRCRFHEYRDEGFSCVLEDLEIKQGLLFIAFTNHIKR